MLPSLRSYIRTHTLFDAGERVGVAVSGGADSVALLRGLLELRSELGIVLSVAHVHHGIRAAEADGDESFVADLAKEFDLPLHLERVDVPTHSTREKLSLETSARELRYAFFKRLLQGDVCDKIATAHTLDDQAETVLLRILRGTGTRGLAAIPPLRNASPELASRIVRPFLAIKRAEIESYLNSIQQPWRDDATNTDSKHLRNRIRHELLPRLEREYNPALRQSLVNLAEIARAEEEHWSAEVKGLQGLTSNPAEIDRAHLLQVPLALRRRVLVELADRLNVPITFEDVERMLQIAANPGLEHSFEGGWQVASTRKYLQFRPAQETALTPGYDLPLPTAGTLDLPNGVRMTVTVVPSGAATGYNPSNLLAEHCLELPLRVRNWQPGDRFWPAGTKRPEKLKRLFQECHIPADARSSWPVVLSGETIVWVRGFPVAAGFQAEEHDAVMIEAVESRQA